MTSFKLLLLILLASPDPITEAAAQWDHLSEGQRNTVVAKLTIHYTEDYIFTNGFDEIPCETLLNCEPIPVLP